jgi:IclR family transcriptional regulator, pca regulon regulatory protein
MLSMPIPVNEKPKSANYFSESLARGLLVIRAFGQDAPVLRPSEVAVRTGLTRAAARRYLLTLQDLGYVGHNGDKFYLRPRVLEIGFSYLASVNLEHIVQPYLNELAETTHERSSFAVLDNGEVLFVARASSQGTQGFSRSIGGRVAAHSTSLGHVLLAGLPPRELNDYLASLRPLALQNTATPTKKRLRETVVRVRQKGWAAMDWRHGDGIASIAVPIRDRAGNVLAAVNVMQFPGRLGPDVLAKKHLVQLQNTAAQMEAALNASGHFSLGARA